MFYLLLIGNVKEVFKNTEIKIYFLILIISVATITINIYPLFNNIEEAFRTSLFQVASIISTTGYAATFKAVEFTVWPALSQAIILILMCFTIMLVF